MKTLLSTLTIALALSFGFVSTASAVEKCKAKLDKRSGVVFYLFKSSGPVKWSYWDYGPFNTHDEAARVFSFGNGGSCQGGGKGKGCVVSTKPKLAKIMPTECTTYLYDTVDNSTCSVNIPGCQPAVRPLPTEGHFCVAGTGETPTVWNAETGSLWVVPDTTKRSLEAQETQLSVLKGEAYDESAGEPDFQLGASFSLPTARRLGRLASACVELLQSGDPGQKPCLASVCTAMWPNPSGSDNCAWSRTADANDPSQAVQVCIGNAGGGSSASGKRPHIIIWRTAARNSDARTLGWSGTYQDGPLGVAIVVNDTIYFDQQKDALGIHNGSSWNTDNRRGF